jgi:cytidylate kinase
MTRSKAVVAIDGPAGAGKTSVAKLLAQALGYPLVGTGAMYRAVALAAEELGISWDDEPRVGAMAVELAKLGALRLEPSPLGGQRVWLHSQDVTHALGTERIGGGASRVSQFAGVRVALLELQRRAGRDGGVVLEGRDIGTVVFPDAEAKFFLTATAEVRALRRYQELAVRGIPCDLASIQAEVAERDQRDATRAVAPLEPAPDAMVVDSSSLTVDEVAKVMLGRVREVERRLGMDR